MLYTKKFVFTVSLYAVLAASPVLAVDNPIAAVAGAKSGKPGEVSTVYSDWAGRATSGIAGVSYVNSAVDAAGNAAQWAENHAAAAAQSASGAAESASEAAESAKQANATLKKAVQRSSETAGVGSTTLPVYVKQDGTVATITSYQGKAATAGTADKAIADKNGAQIDTTYEKLSNKVTALSANSTNTQYPGAKVVFEELNKKQGTISDLDTIRSGASAGATAVQPGDLSAVATSGSYTDLSNKPTIGSGVLTIKRNGTQVGTFNANATAAAEIDITDNDTKYTLPDATKTTKGGVIVGDNINVASGKISVPTATSTTLGVVKQGTNITIAADGTISAKDTVYTLPEATASVLGGVKTGANITNNAGTISVATANGTALGVVKQGTNTTITSGAVNVTTTATPAADSGVPFTAGGAYTELAKKQDKLTTTNIKGAGSVSVAIADGVITVSGTDNDTKYTLPEATASVLGGVKTGANITNNAGTISVATANGTTLGVVKQGTNTTIANGAVNVANATATVVGVSKLGVIPAGQDKSGTAEIWIE